MTADTLKNIVIVGGGPFGLGTARALLAKLDTSKYSLTLITARPFYTHLPGLIRALVTDEDALEEKIFMPYADALNLKGRAKRGEIKIGKVVGFSAWKEGEGGEVRLESGEAVKYEVLLLTPGSVWEGPLALPDTEEGVLAHLREWREKIRGAESYAIVGGGAVGIEFSGELKHYFPDKDVTIVHGQDQLVNAAYPDKIRRRLLTRAQQGGVHVILGDYIDDFQISSAGALSTRGGKEVKTSLVIPARGGRPNTTFIGSSLGQGVLTSSGTVKVESTLQVQGHSHIFAGGDVIEWNEQKQAGKAAWGHAPLLAKNILELLEKGTATGVYKTAFELMLTSFGKSGGVSYIGVLWGLSFGDWVTAKLKSGSLMTELTRSMNGLGKQNE